ncbi:MAG: toxin-antitoxin system YwqK family antitoxin [Bacteroidia bacterium]
MLVKTAGELLLLHSNKVLIYEKNISHTRLSKLVSPAFSQNTKEGPKMQIPARKIEQSYSGDTVITKDKSDPNREYCVIRNAKGQLSAQGSMYKGKKDGVWREYNNQGGLSRIEEYKNGIKSGASVELTFNNQVSADQTYKNDSLNGQKTTYNAGGRIRVIENFSNGILDGPRKSFYDDSKLQEESNYISGKRDGDTKWYFQSGNVSIEYTYKNGILEGPAKEYDSNGHIKREGQFKNDSEDGEWKMYEDTVLTKKVIFKGGEIVKEIPVDKK